MESSPPESTLATHQRIAEAAGVSRSTVSRALQNSSHISETTRQKVREVSEQLGYRPNPFLSALMERVRHRRNDAFRGKIAVITDRLEGARWPLTHPAWRRFHDSARAHALKLGFEFEHFNTRDYDGEGRRLSQILLARGIQSVLVAPGLLEPKLNLEWQNFSAVSVGHGLREPRLHRVCHDHFATIQMACRRLLELGCRRPGLCIGLEHDAVAQQQNRAGFLLVQENLPVENRIEIGRVQGPQPAKRFVHWLKSTRPDVVLTHRCREVVEWARAAGWNCPDELDFFELDLPAGETEFAGVDHHVEFLGRSAVDLVIAQIQRNETGIPKIPADLTLEGHWRDGRSLKGDVVGSGEPLIGLTNPVPAL